MRTRRATAHATQITFHGLKASHELKQEIRERIAWLQQFYPPLMSCKVTLRVPHRHHRHGRHMQVTIRMTVPRHGPLVIAHEPSLDHARVAIREAFDAARRRLQDVDGERRMARPREVGRILASR